MAEIKSPKIPPPMAAAGLLGPELVNLTLGRFLCRISAQFFNPIELLHSFINKKLALRYFNGHPVYPRTKRDTDEDDGFDGSFVTEPFR